LENETVECRVIEKTAGNERDKLVIEPIGITIIEFLVAHFGPLFSYGYTSSMERRLDVVSRNDWHNICSECDDAIKTMIVPIKKASYKIDESHDMIFTKNGPVIRDNVSSELTSINKDIQLDVERLKAGEYTLTELAKQSSRVMGEWKGCELTISNGRYGIYAQWGENKKSLSFIKKPFSQLTVEDVVPHLSKPEKTDANILRVLNDDFSVRTGKYGPYVYYKRANMAKPEFYNIKKFKESFTYCNPEILIQWVRDTYKICD
jgi:DNA topoisomerase-1